MRYYESKMKARKALWHIGKGARSRANFLLVPHSDGIRWGFDPVTAELAHWLNIPRHNQRRAA